MGIRNDRAGYEVRYASISNHTTGAVVAAETGARIVVLGYVLVPDAAGSAQWLTAATPLSGSMELLADTPLVVPSGEHGLFETVAGEALNLTSIAVNGHLAYVVTRP